MKVKTHITWWFLLLAIAINAVSHEDWFTLIDTVILAVSILVSCWIAKSDDDEDQRRITSFADFSYVIMERAQR